MQIDLPIVLAGLVVGFAVGLTGMGGGALMTPILVLVFKVDPLTAVSSDLVASFVMKPVGASVHLRRGTVDLRLVRWLVLGSVPAAFAGVLLLKSLGGGEDLQNTIKVLLGVALLLAASTIVIKAVVQHRRGTTAVVSLDDITIRPALTVAIGVLGGVVVGMTSVGSGSLMVVLLLLVYPSLRASQLVGTDLVQAIPLVGAASVAHILFGDFQFGLTTSLLVGALPGVYIGARMSAGAPDRLIRPVMVLVLTASALKLLGAPTGAVGAGLLAVLVAGTVYVIGGRMGWWPRGTRPADEPAPVVEALAPAIEAG
ncbi:sulfite exporter TauE/SafE family protein [Aquihabitans sp. McL0605]|uniref:sulfite exporter TauE/SafE family protein n=1 Tax=Aquihabitans sp. McL0605 TaxID=3415671 RepID=UPI003CFA4D8E